MPWRVTQADITAGGGGASLWWAEVPASGGVGAEAEAGQVTVEPPWGRLGTRSRELGLAGEAF